MVLRLAWHGKSVQYCWAGTLNPLVKSRTLPGAEQSFPRANARFVTWNGRA